MKKIITLAVLALGLFSACSSSSPQIPEDSVAGAFESQINDEGMVTIEVTPQAFDEKKWIFDVSIKTHSVELDYNLSEITVLSDANGVVYTDPVWEGDPPEGHHRAGKIIFENIASSSTFSLTIKNVAEIEERKFTWELSQ